MACKDNLVFRIHVNTETMNLSCHGLIFSDRLTSFWRINNFNEELDLRYHNVKPKGRPKW